MAAKRDSAGRFIKGSVANPNGRAGRQDQAQAPASHGDGWGNIYSGIGTTTYDRRTSTTFESDIVSDEQAIELMRGDDIAARLVEKLPKHALRPGFDCLIDGDKDLQEDIETRWRELGVKAALERAGCYERSRGGAAILIGAVDGLDLRKPLNARGVREVTALNVFEPREIYPRWYYDDPMRPKFRQPAIYQISPLCPGISESGAARGAVPFEVHESRLIVFRGIQVSADASSRTYNQWGDSVLTRVWRVLRDFNSSWDAIALILQDFSQSIFKIKDLYKLVKNDDFKTFSNRLRALDMGRSVVRAAVLDSEEEFERKSTTLTGVPELMDRMESRMAAAADMPVTVLFGRSPGGLNSTGEGDLQNWHENIADYRDTHLVPALEQLTSCLLAEAGRPELEFKIEGRAIKEESAKEDAETRKLHAEAAKILIESNVVFPEEVARSFWGGDSYNPEIVIDWAEREKLVKEAEALEEKQAKQELEALKAEGVAAQGKPGAERQPKGEE